MLSIVTNLQQQLATFQYPEGFLPDSDSISFNRAGFISRPFSSFSTPKGFGPIVTNQLIELRLIRNSLNPERFQYPEGFWPDSDTPQPVLGNMTACLKT